MALVWLQDPSQAQAAIDLLSTPENMAQFGIQDITPASGLGNYLVVPQNRTPDFIVWPTDGSNGSQAVNYGDGPPSKLVEHGGRGDADQNILMLLEGPGIPVGYTSSQHVWLMQVGVELLVGLQQLLLMRWESNLAAVQTIFTLGLVPLLAPVATKSLKKCDATL